MPEDTSVPARVLVIGATCVDVVISLDRLPTRGGHCRVLDQTMSLGGCAFNVADLLRRTKTSVTFVTPVGTGLYGSFVKSHLKAEGFPVNINVSEENGCCYCLVEPDGERSFIPYHGGEYVFNKEWMKNIDPSSYAFIYAGGIELNEPTGEEIVSWLEDVSGAEPGEFPQVFFAPSPHIGEIRENLISRILALHPILHMNADESRMMSGMENVSDAAFSLREKTENIVVITLGAGGALCLEKEGDPYTVPAIPCDVIDTTGAGDAHAGALLSALVKGEGVYQAVKFANEAASCVAASKGASLPENFFTRFHI